MINPTTIKENEFRIIPNPETQTITPSTIGLREYANGPPVTNFWVGMNGDGVPLQTLKKIITVHKNSIKPAAKRNAPI